MTMESTRLGDMSLMELASTAMSELDGLRRHLGLEPTDVMGVEWDALTIEERVTRAYMASVVLRLTMVKIRLEEMERGGFDGQAHS